MKRWHNELPLMLTRWREEIKKHESSLDLLQETTGELCHCYRGPGFMRKRRPYSCSRPNCGVCHPEKKWKKGRWLRKYKAIEWELRAS